MFKKRFLSGLTIALIMAFAATLTVLACTYLLDLKINEAACGNANVEGSYYASEHDIKIKAELYIDGVLMDTDVLTTNGSHHKAEVSYSGPLSLGGHSIDVYGYRWIVDDAAYYEYVDRPYTEPVYDCELTAYFNSHTHDVSEFYVKETGDPNHCHRIVWHDLSPTAQSHFITMHGGSGGVNDYNHHIDENPTAHLVTPGGYGTCPTDYSVDPTNSSRCRKFIPATYKWSSPEIKSDKFEVASCHKYTVQSAQIVNCEDGARAVNLYDNGVYVDHLLFEAVTWIDPYVLETGLPAIDFAIPAEYGGGTVHFAVFNEPEQCLIHQSTVMIEDGACQYGVGSEKTFLVGDGLTMNIASAIDDSNGFDEDLGPGVTTLTFPNGHFVWKIIADPGYEIVGPTTGEFWTDDFTCRPIPSCPTCGPRVEEVANAPDDLVLVNYGRGPCTICWVTWTADKQEYWRYGRSIHQFSIQVFVPEQQLINAGIAYRTVPYANHPDYKPMLYIDSVPFVGLDGVTYYILDLNKAVVGKSWAYYDTASGSFYREVWGWQSLDRSAYTDCSRTVGPWDVSAAGIATRQYGNPTSSDWVKFLMDNGVPANDAIAWSLLLWASPDGTLALPAGFVLKP
jgi:hypothetical protein